MPKWTPQQKLAMDTRGRDVFVTASAGTGKTSVLTGRCIRILSDAASGIGVRQMLILTFTNAAAQEMRTRIAGALQHACASHSDGRLRRQLMLLDAAHVGTIHSFCQKLLREHFYRLGIDPAFRVIDEDQQRLLRSHALDETIDWTWRQPHLVVTLRELLASRNISARGHSFIEQIFRISNFLDGITDRGDWCRRAVAANDLRDDAARMVSAQQAQLVLKKLRMCRSRLQFAISLDKRLAEGCWSEQIRENRLAYIEECISLMEKGDIRSSGAVIDRYIEDKKKNRFSNRPNGMSEETRDEIHKPIKDAMTDFEELRSLGLLDPTYAAAISPAVSRQTMVLVEMVKRFDYLYQEAKKKADCLDFADLEHLAMRLLGGSGEPSDIAARLRRQYKALFVDEYQDINSVQKQILTQLSAGRNVFAVGDIKQSIYAFRGAVPDIFLDDLKTVLAAPQDALRVDLTSNFRSRQEVLDLVNAVFGRIMTADIAGLAYDEKARLKGELSYEPLAAGEMAVELHLLQSGSPKPGDEDGKTETNPAIRPRDRVSAGQLQAAAIAERIHKMVGQAGDKAQFSIYDKEKDTYRPVAYRDIVILMRSMTSANDYAEVLSLAGIPVHSQSATGYFEATEIADMLALLKVLDNPQRDVELAAVLRSPLFALTDSELLAIRITGNSDKLEKKATFHECVQAFASRGPDGRLREKLAGVLDTLRKWRLLAESKGLAPVLWQAYRQRGYLSFVAALPKGRQRRANLLDLHSRAVQFESLAPTSARGLATFVEFIEKLVEEGGDYRPADVIAPGENAVRIMSVHKSKGLEFPVVFLAEMDKGFNFRDVSADCLCDAGTTLGLTIVDSRRRARRRSMTGEVISARKMAASLAEEMRILYVALTRARERLILTAADSIESCRRILRYGAAVSGGPLPDWMLGSCRSSLEWLLYGLSDRRELHEAFKTGSDCPSRADSALLDVHIVGPDEQDCLAEAVATMKKAHRAAAPAGTNAPSQEVGRLVEAVAEAISWQYPHSAATQVCAKTSVTQLTHRGDEFLPIDLSGSLERMPLALQAGHGLSVEPRALGTATHLVVQSIDISGPCTEQAVRRTIDELVNSGALAADVVPALNAAGIAAFFGTPIGRLAIENNRSVVREWPFTFAMPLAECDPASADPPADEKVIVQGIIDMMIRLKDRLVIVDFKTDRIPAASAARRAKSYEQQLSLYGQAAKAIMNAQSMEKWLYFVSCGQLIQVP